VHLVLGLGTNLGDRGAMLVSARERLEATPLRITAASRVYETEPVGPPQPRYLNAALAIETELDPEAVLVRALEVERSLGRERRERWGPRTIDIDLLLADDEHGAVIRASDTLTLPHPHLSDRAFVLAPLLDVRPDLAPRWQPRLGELGGPPEVVLVKGWTSLDRRK
jgi:2-amino-4-hydroxy-6-hydroxymethyldihydropteridine diphosphokinase